MGEDGSLADTAGQHAAFRAAPLSPEDLREQMAMEDDVGPEIGATLEWVSGTGLTIRPRV